jgi:hypothetical protein
MPIPIDWQQVWNQYGLLGVIIVVLVWIVWNRAATKDHTDKTASNVSAVLAENIGRLGEAILKMSADATHERNDHLMAIKDMAGQVKGMQELTSKTSLSQSSVLTHIHGLTDMWEKEFPVIKTELGDVKEKATSFQSSFTGALDLRFEPVARLLNDVSVQVRDWDARQAAYNDSILKSLTAIHDYIKSLKTEETPTP